MEVKINVDESKFKDVLDKELAAFNSEELHEILKSAMLEYLQNDETLKNVFLKKKYNGWNQEIFEYEKAPVLDQLVSKVSVEPIFEEMRKRILDYFTSDENVKKMSTELFAQLIERGVTNSMLNNENFLSQLAWRIRSVIMPPQ